MLVPFRFFFVLHIGAVSTKSCSSEISTFNTDLEPCEDSADD